MTLSNFYRYLAAAKMVIEHCMQDDASAYNWMQVWSEAMEQLAFAYSNIDMVFQLVTI